MADNTYDQLVGSCERIRDDLEWLSAHEGELWLELEPEEREGREPEDFCTDGDEGEPLSFYGYCCDSLDIQIHGRRSYGDDEWTATHIVIVFGTGGPHIEFTTKAGPCVVGYWGGGKVERSVSYDIGRAIEEAFIEGY